MNKTKVLDNRSNFYSVVQACLCLLVSFSGLRPKLKDLLYFCYLLLSHKKAAKRKHYFWDLLREVILTHAVLEINLSAD
jgi:hypothetical protein